MRITERAIRAAVRRSLRESLEGGRINHKELEELILANRSTVSKIGELIQSLREKMKQGNPITQEEVDNAVSEWKGIEQEFPEDYVDFPMFLDSSLLSSRNEAVAYREFEKISSYREIDKIVLMLLVFMKKIYGNAGVEFPMSLGVSGLMQTFKSKIISVVLHNSYDYDDVVNLLPRGSSERESVEEAAKVVGGSGDPGMLGREVIMYANNVILAFEDDDNRFLQHLDNP